MFFFILVQLNVELQDSALKLIPPNKLQPGSLEWFDVGIWHTIVQASFFDRQA